MRKNQLFCEILNKMAQNVAPPPLYGCGQEDLQMRSMLNMWQTME